MRKAPWAVGLGAGTPDKPWVKPYPGAAYYVPPEELAGVAPPTVPPAPAPRPTKPPTPAGPPSGPAPPEATRPAPPVPSGAEVARAQLGKYIDLPQAILKGEKKQTLLDAGFKAADIDRLFIWAGGLKPEDRALVKTGGIPGLEKWYSRYEARLKKTHIKIPGGYVPVYEYERLSGEEQAAIKGGGIKGLGQLQAQQAQAFEQREVRQFRDLPPLYAEGALKLAERWGGVDLPKPETDTKIYYDRTAAVAAYKKLSRADRDRVWQMMEQVKVAPKSPPLWKIAVGFIPVAGTVVYWKKMEGWEKALSIGLDALVFATIVKIPKLPATGQAGIVAKSAKQAGLAQKRFAEQMAHLKRVSPSSPRYIKLADRAQQATQASKVADIKFIQSLSTLKEISASQLSQIERASKLKGLKQAVTSVSKAQDDLAKAWQKADKVAKSKGSTSPKYIKELTKVKAKQDKLTRAIDDYGTKVKPRVKEGVPPPEFTGKFKTRFTEAERSVTDEIEGFLRTERQLKPTKPQFWETPGAGRVAVAERVAPKVKGKFTLKVEPMFKEAKAAPKKSVFPGIKVRGKTIPGGAFTAATLAQVARRYSVSTDSIVEAITGTTFRELTEGLSAAKAKIVRETTVDAVREAMKQAQEGATRADIIAEVKKVVAAKTGESAKAKDALKGKTEAIVKAATSATTTTGIVTKPGITPVTPIKVPKIAPRLGLVPPPPPLPIIKTSKGKLTIEQIKGAIGWKQGIMYKAIYPPYGEGDIINSRTPIKGIKYVVGAKSAFLSIARITKGRVPPHLARDMGIMDIRISTPVSGRPRIRFKRDVKQRTKLTRGVGRVRT